MKALYILFFINLIYASSIEKFEYLRLACKVLTLHSNFITASKAKTDKTKCYAIKDIKINDTIFTYNPNDILSSETCFHPNKTEILKNISSYTNDTYKQNKMLLSFCIYNILINPDEEYSLSKSEKLRIFSLPIDDVQHSELLFNYSDLNEFLIAGTKYLNSESEMIGKIIDRNLNIKDRFNPNFILYTKIYYYISSHSFNIKDQAVILPFLDVCNIAPHYLSRPYNNFSSSYFIEQENNGTILVRSNMNLSISEQFAFSYNVSLDNDLLMLKQGVFVHDNLYDRYIINKKFSYEHNYETNELRHNLKRRNLHPSIFNYVTDNGEKDAFFKFELFANETNPLLYRFGLIYFFWWRPYADDENGEFRHIAKQALTLLVRMLYDEKKRIRKKMGVDFDEYMLGTQEDMEFTELNKKLRNFTMEKVHLLNKNIKYLYKDLTVLNFNEIMQNKDKYLEENINKESKIN